MSGMRLIVKTVTRLTIGIIVLYGCYLTVYGHLTIGGGVAGGVVIALAYILYVLAYGKGEAEERINEDHALVALSLGSLAFLLIAGCGYACLETLVLADLAIMLIVSAGLYLVFLSLIVFRAGPEEEKPS
jgi:multicomponent Na+:H+ antiporter subunit B